MHGSTVTQGDPVLITLLGSTSLDSMELSLEPVIKVDSCIELEISIAS